MTGCSIGGYNFLLNPSSAAWSYDLNTKSYDTYGGRVVQVLSCKITGFTISGYLSQKHLTEATRWTEMEYFENAIRNIMEYHNINQKPVSFNFETMGWVNAKVYVQGYTNVSYDVATAAIQYTLTLFVDEGLDTVKDGIVISELENIPSGVNWKHGIYNTPSAESWKQTLDSYATFLEGAGVYNAGVATSFRSVFEQVQANAAVVPTTTQAELVEKVSWFADKDLSTIPLSFMGTIAKESIS